MVWANGTVAAHQWPALHLFAAPWCPKCGYPFAEEGEADLLCASCAAGPSHGENLTAKGRLDRVRSAAAYDDALAPAILKLKYGDRLDTAEENE